MRHNEMRLVEDARTTRTVSGEPQRLTERSAQSPKGLCAEPSPDPAMEILNLWFDSIISELDALVEQLKSTTETMRRAVQDG